MKLTTKTRAKALFLAVCGMTAALTTHATTYTWRGTNNATWGNAGNWLAGAIAPTNITAAHRLEVNNVGFTPMTYDAGEGTTTYGSSSVRGLVVASGANGSGTMNLTGGTFISANGSTGDVVGNSDNNVGILNISGGTLVSGSSLFNLGLGGGPGRESDLNVNSGTATVGTISINSQRSTINFNGGTTIFSNMTANIIAGPVVTNNFNGGTIKPRANSAAFIPALTQANVRDGGAIFDTTGFNITVLASLAHSVIAGDAAIDGGVTKLGLGTLTLSGLNSYTGPTKVSQGTMAMGLPSSSSSLVISSGTIFSLSPNDSNWSVDPVSVTNATLQFDYGSFDGYTSTVMSVNNLNISGTVTVNVVGSGFPVTDLTLLTYNTKSGGGSFVLGTLPAGATATLQDTGSSLILHITTGSILNLTWTASVDNLWKTNGAANWNSGTGTYQEYNALNSDNVIFDDTLGGGDVFLASSVRPNSIKVINNAGDYNFTGTGSIVGNIALGLVKGGSAGLFISTSNTFSGPITITNGTLWVNHSNALGATNSGVTVSGSSSTLEIGTNGGAGIRVSGKSVTISGTGVGGSRGALRGAATASGTNIWAGPVAIAANQTRIGTEDNGNLTIAGAVTDNGNGYSLLLRPGISGVLTMAGSGNYFSTLTFGDVTSIIRLGANNALSTNLLAIGIGSIDLNGFSQSFAGINNSGTPGTITNGASGASTLTIYAAALASFSESGDIMNGSGSLSVVKTGAGTQTLSGNNLTYTGNTTINGGVLNLASPNPMTTAITVNSGGSLGGEGTTTGSLTLNAGGGLSVNPNTPGSFVAGAVTVAGSPVNVSFTAIPANNSDVLVLTATGGFTGSVANFRAANLRGGVFFYTNSNTELHYLATAAPASLVWKGNNASKPTFWDVVTTTNWSNGGTPDLFYSGDNVLFDNTASTNFVDIQGGSIQPGNIVVNSTNDYTINGIIAGAATLTKGGTGTLLLTNNNTYSGLTLITNGMVNIQPSGALGNTAAGTVISGNGTLDIATGAFYADKVNLGAEVLTISGNGFGGNGCIVNSSLTASQINAMQQIVMAGNASIGGNQRWDMRNNSPVLDMQSTNTLTKVGVNQISLVGTLVNNPGNIVINSGILGLETQTDLGGSSANTLTINNGGTLRFWSLQNAGQWTMVLNGGSTVLGVVGVAANHWAGPVTLNGAATLDASGGNLYFDGQISGSGSLTKNGTSSASLTVSNSYTGNTTVNAGTLNLDVASLASSSTISIASGAVLNLNFAETNTVAALVLNGTNQPAGVYDATTGAPFITGTGVLLVAPSAPPTLSVTSLGGNQLQFSWTGGGTLQAQTNSLSTGLGTNWVNYPGSSPVTITINPSAGSVFFRVKQ